MSDYTPTTETIRDRIVSSNYTQGDQPDLGAAFDRWLAARDAEVYRRGREDAAKAVEAALNDYVYGEEYGPPEFRLIAAARGDGEQA